MQVPAESPVQPWWANRMVRSSTAVVRNRLRLIVMSLVGLYAGLPWMAPVLMRLGWIGPAQAIYAFYSTQCHQMAQRSYFLFGPAFMLSPAELAAAGVPLEPFALRAFLGSPELGWKVAWSDRMAAMYLGLFLSMLVVNRLGSRLRPLPAAGIVIMLLPLVLDGATHLISDLAGIGVGFRDSNQWLALLTQNRFPARFYAGDAWGSFNADMRLLTGALFGLALAWLVVPLLRQLARPFGLPQEKEDRGKQAGRAPALGIERTELLLETAGEPAWVTTLTRMIQGVGRGGGSAELPRVPPHPSDARRSREETRMATDPVCGMPVDETSALHKAEYDGKTYYFCASACRRDFEREPQKYLRRDQAAITPWHDE